MLRSLKRYFDLLTIVLNTKGIFTIQFVIVIALYFLGFDFENQKNMGIFDIHFLVGEFLQNGTGWHIFVVAFLTIFIAGLIIIMLIALLIHLIYEISSLFQIYALKKDKNEVFEKREKSLKKSAKKQKKERENAKNFEELSKQIKDKEY